MDEELQLQPQEKNKTTFIIVFIVVVILIAILSAIFIGNNKDVFGVYVPSTEQVELTEQQRTEKEKLLKATSDESVELTEEERQNKRALLESISKQ